MEKYALWWLGVVVVCPCWLIQLVDANKYRTDATIRDHRFPSVEERIQLYMSNWYVPPCHEYDDGFVQYSYVSDQDQEWPQVQLRGLQNHPLVNASADLMLVDSIVTPDMLFYMEPEIITNCANGTFDEESTGILPRQLELAARVKFRGNMRMYCHDVQDSVFAAWYHVQWEQQQQQHLQKQGKEEDTRMHIPTLLQFGDNKESHIFKNVMVPHLKKFRSASQTPQDLEYVTTLTSKKKRCLSAPRDTLKTVHDADHRFQPIVWKLATHRHFEKLYQVYRMDTVWEQKKNMAVFRGQLTGSRDGYDKYLSDEENCHRLKRCELVYNHANSTLIYAKLTSTRGRLPAVVNDVSLIDGKVGLDELLEYKGIIMLEGNDVASGLKWALLSQSVVLMPPPKHTSWAMEELLEPWVHYVPLDDFATNVEERMQWVVDNDAEAQRISERGTLWMEDLVFHPDAAEDDRLIQEEILRRYQTHFRPL